VISSAAHHLESLTGMLSILLRESGNRPWSPPDTGDCVFPMNRIIHGDVLRFAEHYHGPKFHAVICDPPYELGFMGKGWDSRGVSFNRETWAAIRSLLVPGAHLLAFGGTRTFHRIAVAIEDAGFEIRDTIGWLYGSGFPKSHDVSKAIDRDAGAEREVIGPKITGDGHIQNRRNGTNQYGTFKIAQDGIDMATAPATDAARAWQGYGTALKPAWEPVIVARNPLSGTVAQNAIEHGAGALNVDGGRVGTDDVVCDDGRRVNTSCASGYQRPNASMFMTAKPVIRSSTTNSLGRWPANIIHDGSDEVADVLGDARRFFYCAKAGKREREDGLSGFEVRVAGAMQGEELRDDRPTNHPLRANHHPTVKPIALTEYLAKLILPAAVVGERRIFVPFAGSGSECIGAMLAGWETIVGVEREDEYAKIARARLQHWAAV
jgi:DNA modification methylase